ncbi:MAG: CoA transferase [Deltaproteobacteria bacterium]|nr:CoA transferase [Deltaproteobacteria bacterium]
MNIFQNITIISLEQATVLPYLTYRLVQDGMKVIRLEHPVYGDPNRMVGENRLGEERMNTYFMAINAGKKALTLDLTSDDGKEIFRRLITELKADIFATNQLPKNYARLGIDYDTIKSIKEDIIWLGVTGFGPDSDEVAYDPILQARSGLMDLTGERNGPPQVLGIPLPDMGTSEHAYGLVMKALLERHITGQGSRLDVSMFESTVSWLTVPITLTETFGKNITRRGNTHEFFAPVSVFKTKDGFVYIAVGNDRQWENITKLPGFEALAREEYRKNEGRIADVINLNKQLGLIMEKMAGEELITGFNQAGVAISKIKNIRDVTADPLVARRLLHAKDSRTDWELTLAPPPYMTPYLESCDGQLSFPPRFGEHNEKIYTGRLGYSSCKLSEFKEKKVI